MGRLTGRVLVYNLQAVYKLADQLQEWKYADEEAKLYRCGSRCLYSLHTMHTMHTAVISPIGSDQSSHNAA